MELKFHFRLFATADYSRVIVAHKEIELSQHALQHSELAKVIGVGCPYAITTPSFLGFIILHFAHIIIENGSFFYTSIYGLTHTVSYNKVLPTKRIAIILHYFFDDGKTVRVMGLYVY